MSKVMGPGRAGSERGPGWGVRRSSPVLTVMTLRSKRSSRSNSCSLSEDPKPPSASWSGILHHQDQTKLHDDVAQKAWT